MGVTLLRAEWGQGTFPPRFALLCVCLSTFYICIDLISTAALTPNRKINKDLAVQLHP